LIGCFLGKANTRLANTNVTPHTNQVFHPSNILVSTNMSVSYILSGKPRVHCKATKLFSTVEQAKCSTPVSVKTKLMFISS